MVVTGLREHAAQRDCYAVRDSAAGAPVVLEQVSNSRHNFFRLNPIVIGVATADFPPSICRFGKVLRRMPCLTQPPLDASYGDTLVARWTNSSTAIDRGKFSPQLDSSICLLSEQTRKTRASIEACLQGCSFSAPTGVD